jgi:hypothetical protein
MKFSKFLLVGVAGVLAGGGAMSLGGCGSSSNSSGGNDGGGDATTTDDGGSSGPMCNPTDTTMHCPVAMGLTCCIDPTNIAGLLTGAPCVPKASCTTSLQYECLQTSDCASGQVCCATVAGDAGILEAGLPDAGIGEGGIGALLEGGAGGLGGIGAILGAINVHVSCESACNGMQLQLCGSDKDCTSPNTCQATALPGAGPLAGGAGGGDGGGFNLASMFPNMIMPKSCTPPDAGASEAGGGTPEGGSDAGDAGTTAETGTTTEGGSDAPTE